MTTNHDDVLTFWFEELNPEQWFGVNPAIDKDITKRFKTCLERASKGEVFHWRETVDGRLAEIIVLDQFSRNIFRGSSKSFENDSMALVLAQELLALRLDEKLPTTKKSFAYMPFMHSESKELHKIAMKLFSQPGLELNLKFEVLHKEIIDRFGRYPHRNKILGRDSTPEEVEFLKTHPGF